MTDNTESKKDVEKTTSIVYNPVGQLAAEFPEFKALDVYGTTEDPLFPSTQVRDMLLTKRIHFNEKLQEGEHYVEYECIARDGKKRTQHLLTEAGVLELLYTSSSPLAAKMKRFILCVVKQLRTKGIVTIDSAMAEYKKYAKRLESQLDDMNDDLKRERMSNEKYHNKYVEAWHEISRLRETVRLRDSNDEIPHVVKQHFYKKVYIYDMPIPEDHKDKIEDYDPLEEPHESDERIWYVTLVKKPTVDFIKYFYIPPKVSPEEVAKALSEYAFGDKKGQYFCSIETLQEVFDSFALEPLIDE